MKILIADKFDSEGVDRLRGLASELVADASLKEDALGAKIAEFDPTVLIVRSTKVTASILDNARSLRMILRAGSGVDTIDVGAASEHGIGVANCPGMNAVAVAELTMGMILSLDRSIPDNVIDFRNRTWNKKAYSAKANGLKGRTLGIIGAGKIGSEVARRAVAFEMNVLYTHLGRSRGLVDLPQCRRTETDDLMREADFVTVHVPGGSGTKHIIDSEMIGEMKPSACLINTSRASVIDEQAMVIALREGRLAGAAIDVFNDEPAADAKTFETALIDVPNLYVTHHIGASTAEAQRAVADETVRIVKEFKTTNRILNCVNLNEQPVPSLLVVRLRNRPGGLAHVFSLISQANINVEEMDHVIFDGGKSACAHIRLSPAPNDDLLEQLRSGHENVLAAELMPG